MKVEITTILGIDLAWGTRMPDAVARIDYSAAAPDCPLLVGHAYTSGDDELLAHLEQQADADKLEAAGYDLSWQLGGSTRTAVEVYPHPAMVRWFGLERTIKYKRGPVANKRLEFQRYQQELRAYIEEAWPEMVLPENFQVVLGSLWSKRSEDLLDAYFCALIGLWHIAHAGERTQVLGDLLTGHMIVPMSNEIPPT